jgi:hypothetical protein
VADLGAAQLSIADQSGNELPADHPGRTDHGNMHAVHPQARTLAFCAANSASVSTP